MYSVGHLVISSLPYVSVLNRSQRLSRCDYCFQQLNSYPQVTKCDICDSVFYCCKECKEHDRRAHGYECQYLSGCCSDTVRLMMRLLGRQSQDNVGESLPDGSTRTLEDLLDHKDDIWQNNSLVEKVCQTYQKLEQCSFKHLPMFNEFLSLFGKVLINGFTVADLTSKNIATGLYALFLQYTS